MPRVVRFAFLASLLLLSSVPRVCHPAEPVTLSADVVWSGAVDVATEVVVGPEATLLVLPGTIVRFAKQETEGAPPAKLTVRGVLVAQGTAQEPIVFTSSAQDPRPGDWGGVVFDQSSRRTSRLQSCRIEYATHGIAASMAAVTLEHCELRGNRIGLNAAQRLLGRMFDCVVEGNEVGLYFNQSQGFMVENSRIRRNAKGGAICVNASEPRIGRCSIEDNGNVGVSCIQGASPLIEGNEIRGHERGVHLELKSNPRLLGNTIAGNQTGVWAEKLVFPVLERNVISGNGVGVYCNYSAYPKLHGNDLSGNDSFALVLGDQQSIQVERQIPYRDQGQFFSEAPQSPLALPPQARKFANFDVGDDGMVDARANWWGEEPTAQMRSLGEEGNVGAIEDGRDKPDTEYMGKKFPRDRVAFAPWEEKPLSDVGRREARYSGVRGKVMFAGKAAQGVRVLAYENADDAFRGEGVSYSAPSGADGGFTLSLKPGRYFLVAKRPQPPFPASEPAPGELFGYYGGNPVLVSAGAYREVTLYAVARRPVERGPGERPEDATLEGVALGPSGPLEGVLLHLYPDAARDFRGPDLFGPQGAAPGGTDPEGRFSIQAPPGKYYLVATRRKQGRGLGPLQVGDSFGYFDGNPLVLGAGERVALTVQLAEKAQSTDGAAPGTGAGLLGIRGVIRDPAGGVPRGVYAYASPDPNLMIGTMPPFRSLPVGADGAYFIDLPGPGTYYVGARSGYGGPPMPGEWFGVHGAEMPEPVTVEEGSSREGVDVVVRRME
jgi:parallel beta-helix repeat protein